ncbi:hypothetical protein ACFT2C_00960 [Promicromonospora sp. NPDC057138]|uniref:hypothetical protein n=1 Tax=Promicromonospora sp. NPDC057138 TaxID=3346031 RepID=UPI00362AAC16
MKSLPDAGRRPAALSILALAVAAWMSVPLRLLIPGIELNFGFTMDNAIFVIENAAMAGTVVLAVGATALRGRRVLTAAIVVAGLHLVFQLGTVVVQLANGARPELVLGTLVALLVLTAVLGGAVLGRVLHAPASARRTGVITVLVGAFIHTLWTNVLLPMVAILPYGGPPPGMAGSLVLTMALSLIVIAVPVLCGWASPTTRRIGALLGAVVGVLGIASVTGTLGAYGGAYAAVQVVQGLVTLAAVALAAVAGRRLAASRQATSPADAQPQAEAQPSAEA